MNSRLVVVIGVALALWMSLGRWLFGIGGTLSWWYVPSIGLVYALLHIWLGRMIAGTRANNRRTSRGTIVTTVLSWLSAIGFGFTVPDLADGALESILSNAAGSAFSAEMSIALCNPLGIVAFTLAGASLFFANADRRGPKPEEEQTGEMRPHPFL